MKLLTGLVLAVALILLVSQLMAQALERRIAPGLLYEDHIYHESLKTPLLFPVGGSRPGETAEMQPPVVPLSGTLQLRFDWLGSDQPSFRLKLLSCNADWTPSVLSEVEYLSDFNDFPIYDQRVAQGTKVAYTQYHIDLPRVRRSGNYLLVVSKGRGEADVVLTRRLMVYEPLLRVGGRVGFAQDASLRNTHQQLDLTLNYGQYLVLNPRLDLRVLIRQNYRWDRTLTAPTPFMVREIDQTVEYRLMDNEQLFEGGNEFHFFDIRSRQMRGMGVGRLDFHPNFNAALLLPIEPQARQAYIQYDDLDGRFLVETRDDFGDPDYFAVTFFLKAPEDAFPSPPVVQGGFNFFSPAERTRFNPETGMYQYTTVLKQGVYNYLFSLENPKTARTDSRPIEGSHALTQNTYEVFVYHRPPGDRADRLVGYQRLRAN